MLLTVLNGTDTDELVMETACKIARHTKDKILCVYIIVVPRNKPIDQEIPAYTNMGERTLQHAEEEAMKFKIKIKGQILQARSKGVSIVNYAKEEMCELLILGITKDSLDNKQLLDPDTRYVLLNSNSKVITCRL